MAAIAHVNAFNRQIKVLVTDVKKRLPNDAIVARTHSRIILGIGFDPMCAIGTVGPYLYKYKEQIFALENGGDESFFLNRDYTDEVKQGSSDTEKVDAAFHLIPKAKECMRTMSENDKSMYKEMIVKLLDTYILYLEVTML